MQKEIASWSAEPAPDFGPRDEQISRETLQVCAGKALNAAIKLAALNSRWTEAELHRRHEQYFRQRSGALAGGTEDKDPCEPSTAPETEVSVTATPSFETLFEQIRASQTSAAENLPEQVDDQGAAEIEAVARLKAEGADAPSRELTTVVSAVATADKAGSCQVERVMPVEGRCTLAAALHGHASFEGAQDHLWRLLRWLRRGPEGCDRRWVKNHFTCPVGQPKMATCSGATGSDMISAWPPRTHKCQEESGLLVRQRGCRLRRSSISSSQPCPPPWPCKPET